MKKNYFGLRDELPMQHFVFCFIAVYSKNTVKSYATSRLLNIDATIGLLHLISFTTLKILFLNQNIIDQIM